jgi:hypothetical protein
MHTCEKQYFCLSLLATKKVRFCVARVVVLLLWSQMLLQRERWPLAPLWVDFLEKGGKTPSRDAWNMVIEFMQSVKPDMSDYDASGESELSSP